MSNEIENYIKELLHLKSLGLVVGEDAEELDGLIEKLNHIDVDEENLNPNNQEFNIPIKFVNTSNNPDPVYAKDGDSGFDLRANFTRTIFKNGQNIEVNHEYVMKPFERSLIPTGLFFELPYGYELQIRPRSGHSFKTGLMAILGTVDRDYRGEVKVILINLSDKDVTIEHGERIAQGVVAPRVSTELGKLVKLTSVEQLSETDRGVSGFGSTGNK
ncbi:MAG: dUTP diphosphatase [bacterium]|jgi:dUTP pyrophosphatase